MIESSRAQFNASFSPERYQQLLAAIHADFQYTPTFRVAETPIFIDAEMKGMLLEACQQLLNYIQAPDFKEKSEGALAHAPKVPNENPHPEFLAIDFGLCEEQGRLVPKLIEAQGFPSIFNFQYHLYQKYLQTYPFLSAYTPFLSGLEPESYQALLRQTILGDAAAEEVVLLEIEPEKQNTKIDFYYCARDLGIQICCVTEVIKVGKQLFYKTTGGELQRIKRIYNRVIFDELSQRKDLHLSFSFEEELDVYWVGHPNWFFRVSKYLLPDLKGPYFIETQRLSEVKLLPKDLENYVLKPLFSFSGAGVVFHVTPEAIAEVEDPEHYILQKKVQYKPLIQALEGQVKAEVRMLFLWPAGQSQATPVANLVRLSRGEMIGVKFNKDKDWVGGSIGLFEK